MIRIKEVYADCSKEAEEAYYKDDLSVTEKYAAKTIIAKNSLIPTSTVLYLDEADRIIGDAWVSFTENGDNFPKFGEVIYEDFEIYNEEEARLAQIAKALKEKIANAVSEKVTSIALTADEIEAFNSEHFINKNENNYEISRDGRQLNIKYI